MVICPRCSSTMLIEIGDGVYRCKSCGYTGYLDMDREIQKT